jgi:hypothetical protein
VSAINLGGRVNAWCLRSLTRLLCGPRSVLIALSGLLCFAYSFSTFQGAGQLEHRSSLVVKCAASAGVGIPRNRLDKAPWKCVPQEGRIVKGVHVDHEETVIRVREPFLRLASSQVVEVASAALAVVLGVE